MAKIATLRAFHSLLTLHLHPFHFQSKGTPKRQCLNWKRTVFQLRARSRPSHQDPNLPSSKKAQYPKLIFPKATFFHLSFAYPIYRNTERRLKFVFWEQEGVGCSVAAVSLLSTQSNPAFAQSSLAVQTQPAQFSRASCTSPQTEVPARVVSLWKKTEIAFLNWMRSPGTF